MSKDPILTHIYKLNMVRHWYKNYQEKFYLRMSKMNKKLEKLERKFGNIK